MKQKGDMFMLNSLESILSHCTRVEMLFGGFVWGLVFGIFFSVFVCWLAEKSFRKMLDKYTYNENDYYDDTDCD